MPNNRMNQDAAKRPGRALEAASREAELMPGVEPKVRRWPSVVLALLGAAGVVLLGFMSMVVHIHEEGNYSQSAHVLNLIGACIMIVAAVVMGISLRGGRVLGLFGLIVGVVGAGINFVFAM